MPMNPAQKAAQVEALTENFNKAISTVFVNFSGVDVETITELRSKFREAGIDYRVVKNSLIKRAIEASEQDAPEEINASLVGMTGVAWSYEDPSTAAKILQEFRKAHKDTLAKKNEPEKLIPKCALMDGQLMDAAAVDNTLAKMPGKDEVRAQLLAQLMAPAQNLVAQLNAPGQNLALVLDAYRRENAG